MNQSKNSRENSGEREGGLSKHCQLRLGKPIPSVVFEYIERPVGLYEKKYAYGINMCKLPFLYGSNGKECVGLRKIGLRVAKRLGLMKSGFSQVLAAELGDFLGRATSWQVRGMTV